MAPYFNGILVGTALRKPDNVAEKKVKELPIDLRLKTRIVPPEAERQPLRPVQLHWFVFKQVAESHWEQS